MLIFLINVWILAENMCINDKVDKLICLSEGTNFFYIQIWRLFEKFQNILKCAACHVHKNK